MPIILAQVESPPGMTQPLPSGFVTTPDWVGKPTGQDFARLFPIGAQRENLEGQAVIQCGVSMEGRLADCRVTSEIPRDAGFGQATLQLAPLFKMRPLDRDRQPVVGRAIKIPVRWVLPGGVTAKPATLSLPGLAGHVELDCRAAADGHFDNCLVLQSSSGLALADAAVQAVGKFKVPTGTPLWLRVTFALDVVAGSTSPSP